MMRHLFVLLLSIVTLPAIGAGQVSYMDINNGVVIFATDEGKTGASPECVAESTADKWALSLQSDNGRAMYSLLMTAMASDMAIGVESAVDCADTDGVERPQRLWFDNTEVTSEEATVETVTTYEIVAYGRLYNGSCSIYTSLKSKNGKDYMYRYEYSSGDTDCRCQEDSIRVVNSYEDYGKANTYYQCVIEVETPLVNSSSN